MRARCRRRPNYAGRGITVCERWDTSYEAFLTDMGRRPSKRHSIERLDNDRGYEPSNCVWATTKTQARNKRTNTLDMVMVREMRRLHETGIAVCEIAERFDQKYHSVWNAVRGKTWLEEGAG